MKKLILVVALIAVFGGCADTQGSINRYLEVRGKVIKTTHIIECEKQCFKKCDAIESHISRIDCKASCVEECNK